MALVAQVKAASLVAPDETAYDLFQIFRHSRGSCLPCFDDHLPASVLAGLVVLHGDTASGKSVLLRNILATHLLPASCGGHGLPSVLIDADQSFDLWLLAKLLQDKAKRAGCGEGVSEVEESLERLVVCRPLEPLELLQQLSDLRQTFALKPRAALLVVDSMSAWQSMTAAFPRSSGAVLKECWKALSRLQEEASLSVLIAHREGFQLDFELKDVIHLGIGCCPVDENSETECFYLAPWDRLPASGTERTFFVVSPAGGVLTVSPQPQ